MSIETKTQLGKHQQTTPERDHVSHDWYHSIEIFEINSLFQLFHVLSNALTVDFCKRSLKIR